MEVKQMEENLKVSYDVVSEFAGHQPNKDVLLVEAAKDIFNKVKEKAMQCAVRGEFIEFDTIQELESELKTAVISGYSIRVHDENIGG
jgi:hypothetical protein